MQIVLSDSDLEALPGDLKVRLLTHLLAAIPPAGCNLRELHGFRYDTSPVFAQGDHAEMVVLDELQVEQLTADLVRKMTKATGKFERAIDKLERTGDKDRYGATVDSAQAEAAATIPALNILDALAEAEAPAQATPAILADRLKLKDARQLGPILNSINKSLQKITRNPTAVLFVRDESTGGYLVHPDTRKSILDMFEKMNRAVDEL